MGVWGLWNVGIAGLLGAAGVALAAVAAHRTIDPSLATAAMFLIVHGAAVVALSAMGGATATGFLTAGSLMLLGVALFSGDVSLRVLAGARLFPMAAPTGGMLLISAWLLAGVSGILAALRSG